MSEPEDKVALYAILMLIGALIAPRLAHVPDAGDGIMEEQKLQHVKGVLNNARYAAREFLDDEEALQEELDAINDAELFVIGTWKEAARGAEKERRARWILECILLCTTVVVSTMIGRCLVQVVTG